MNKEKLAVSLQQDLLTLLVHDEQHGRSISKILTANLFEGDYRNIADKALAFWKAHNAPPKQHIADLLASILEDPNDRRASTYRRILVQMFEVKDDINPEYVLKSMGAFMRMQKAWEVILESSEKLDASGITGLEAFEDMWRGFLRDRANNLMDAGIRLSDVDKVLDFIQTSQNEFITGIKELDQGHIVPMRGKVMLFVAPTGAGKTWFLVQLGKMAFLRRKTVVHISLEIESEEVIQRYYQALFGASKREETADVHQFKFDKRGGLEQIVKASVDVPFNFASSAIREELQTRIKHFGTRAENIIVKRFPMRSLTVDGFEAYLEYLETVEKIIPDLVILDYPGIMKTDEKNHRISLGRLFENLRGVAQRRNFALAAAHQASKAALDAVLVKASHGSEDWSMIGTSDFVITFSQTVAEKLRGLARLFVDKGRSEADKFGVLITQSYRTGQMVLESTRLADSYARLMEQMGTDDDEESGDDED